MIYVTIIVNIILHVVLIIEFAQRFNYDAQLTISKLRMYITSYIFLH